MQKVKVYTTEVCPYCQMVKKFLKDNNVEFEEIDVSSDEKAAQELVDKSGQMGVPLIEIDGEIIVGFNEQALRKALKLE